MCVCGGGSRGRRHRHNIIAKAHDDKCESLKRRERERVVRRRSRNLSRSVFFVTTSRRRYVIHTAERERESDRVANKSRGTERGAKQLN